MCDVWKICKGKYTHKYIHKFTDRMICAMYGGLVKPDPLLPALKPPLHHHTGPNNVHLKYHHHQQMSPKEIPQSHHHHEDTLFSPDYWPEQLLSQPLEKLSDVTEDPERKVELLLWLKNQGI